MTEAGWAERLRRYEAFIRDLAVSGLRMDERMPAATVTDMRAIFRAVNDNLRQRAAEVLGTPYAPGDLMECADTGYDPLGWDDQPLTPEETERVGEDELPVTRDVGFCVAADGVATFPADIPLDPETWPRFGVVRQMIGRRLAICLVTGGGGMSTTITIINPNGRTLEVERGEVLTYVPKSLREGRG